MNETDRDDAYVLIDRFLRNRLDDEAYAEYSAALELCFTDKELRQQLATAKEENSRLALSCKAWRGESATSHAIEKQVSSDLADSQKQVTLLRGATKKFLSDNDPEGFGCACEPNHLCGPCSERQRQKPLYAALAATDDLSGVIPCHAKPAAWKTVEMLYPPITEEQRRSSDVPLYHAWKPT